MNHENRKTLRLCCAAFGLTLLCALVVYLINRVFPFGANRLLYSDMIAEYLPYLTEFYDKLHSGGSLFYTWAAGFGGSFWGTMCYYVLSPFNVIALLLPRAALATVLCALIPLRQCLSAAAMTAGIS